MFLARDEFEKFTRQIKGESYEKIIQEAKHEHSRCRSSHRDKDRQQKAQYRALMSGFLFWLQHGIKPTGLSDEEFATFRPICEELVSKNQLAAEALEAFGPKKQ
jgi:hypothetical protein